MGKDATRSYRPTARHYIGLDKTKRSKLARHDPIKISKKPKKTAGPKSKQNGPNSLMAQQAQLLIPKIEVRLIK